MLDAILVESIVDILEDEVLVAVKTVDLIADDDILIVVVVVVLGVVVVDVVVVLFLDDVVVDVVDVSVALHRCL